MRAILALCLLCALCLSCEYKDLCYDHNHWAGVNVVFDWQHAPEALQTKAGDAAQGAGMTVLFYNMENPLAEPVRYDLPGRLGGSVRLLPGTWLPAAYNYDTETILYRGMEAPESLEAYTRLSSIEEGTQLSRAGMPKAASTEDEPVILEPDPLWGCTAEHFTLTMADPSAQTVETRVNNTRGNGTTVTMMPRSRVYELRITIHNVPNLQYTTQFGGALSGLAPSVWMQSGVPGEGRATQAFTCQVVDDKTLEMHTRIFGHCPRRSEGDINKHLLTIYAILADGTKWYYTEDVTNLMHKEQADDHHIYLELDGLPVPKPIVNGSGFMPTIDGWQGVEIEVGM